MPPVVPPVGSITPKPPLAASRDAAQRLERGALAAAVAKVTKPITAPVWAHKPVGKEG